MKKKSYNPFKMWGSYVGLVLALILTYITITTIMLGDVKLIFTLEGLKFFFLNIKSYIVIPIGFLIGYGIHVLIRGLRK